MRFDTYFAVRREGPDYVAYVCGENPVDHPEAEKCELARIKVAMVPNAEDVRKWTNYMSELQGEMTKRYLLETSGHDAVALGKEVLAREGIFKNNS